MASKAKRTALAVTPDINTFIVELRGQKVILDADLSSIYGAATKYPEPCGETKRQPFPA